EGVAIRLRRRSVLVIQNHYHPVGKVESDRSMLGLYFAKSPPKAIGRYTGVQIKSFEIPAGARHHALESLTPHNHGFSILAVTPHMHLLGEEMKVTVLGRDGKLTPLIWVRDWDPAWQTQYLLDRPLHIGRGDQIRLQAWFDNSALNPLN